MGTFTWLSSWPFDVPTNTRSPAMVGEELARLWGKTPSSPIMSRDQMTSASFKPVSFSSVMGPSFSLSRNPCTSMQKRTARLLT